MVRYGVRRTLPARLLDAVEFSDTHSSPVKGFRHPEFISNIVKSTSFAESGLFLYNTIQKEANV